MSPSRPRPRTAVGGVALLLALTGTAVAVTTLGGTTPASADELLPAFDDCDALTERMASLAMPYVGSYGMGGVEGDRVYAPPIPPGMPNPAVATDGRETAPMAESAAGTAGAPMAASKSSADAAAPASGADAYARNSAEDAVGPGKTGTNLQEAGVDEPDVAKTDGRYVYSLDGGVLRIVDVDGSSPDTRGSLDLQRHGMYPSELLLAGDRALVLGTANRYNSPGGRDIGYGESEARYGGLATAVLAVVDVSDRDDPKVIATEEITGRQVSARMTGNVVRVVLTSTPELSFRQPSGYYDDSRGGSGLQGGDSALQYNKDVVRFAKAEDWLPSRTIVDGSGRIVSPAAPLVDCADVRYPAEDSGLDMLSVLTLDLTRSDALTTATSTAIVTAGELVYASPERLYVATTQGGWGQGFGGAQWRRPASPRTAVHEFDITDGLDTVYRGSGSVEGYIPGRWALSEYAGNLRVVTTTQEPWNTFSGGGGSASNIVVLRPRRDRLVEVGRVSGMGRGETVRAVRWFDELAAVVTFRQTDPLYLVDMSVPEKPEIRGELKVPGYSAYLHPIGDHRLLGVGQDATDSGRQLGLQVSSFDIADADRPRETDKVTYGQNSTSPVETDARGFVYLPETRTAVLPAQYPYYGSGNGPAAGVCGPGADCVAPYGISSGLVSVKVGKDGRLVKAGSWDYRTGDVSGRFVGDTAVTKVLSLPGGRLAALTAEGLTVLDADDLRERGDARYGR